jgi:predicted transcriptional regulator
MATTIQISKDLQKELTKRKLFENETYEDVIWSLIEDTMEINEQTKKEIEEARADIKAGRFYTFEEVKKSMKKR